MVLSRAYMHINFFRLVFSCATFLVRVRVLTFLLNPSPAPSPKLRVKLKPCRTISFLAMRICAPIFSSHLFLCDYSRPCVHMYMHICVGAFSRIYALPQQNLSFRLVYAYRFFVSFFSCATVLVCAYACVCIYAYICITTTNLSFRLLYAYQFFVSSFLVQLFSCVRAYEWCFLAYICASIFSSHLFLCDFSGPCARTHFPVKPFSCPPPPPKTPCQTISFLSSPCVYMRIDILVLVSSFLMRLLSSVCACICIYAYEWCFLA
ncbi:hypothetical protein K435DRAFT_493940 [Dendrothele bispora CBS 962.96]|uniref:Uncharacterized protein n=1 Tax=Dendrothele bispora (strain CBS 962.96) TaxID=1314807 RepID=A0A4S8MBX3_DENBC|nr:hypothetical protein K435DRAFT_493940 [Dendrothele bispora CBS 962.96]